MEVLTTSPPLTHPTTLQMGDTRLGGPGFFGKSYWYRKITDYTPYQDPGHAETNSANMIKHLCWQMHLDPVTGLPIDSTTAYAWMGGDVPCYVVPAGYPRRPLFLSDMTVQGAIPLDAILRQGVPIPLDAIHSQTPDRWVNIYQPSTDTLWELYRVEPVTTSTPIDRARWGGVIYGVSKHSGTYQDKFEPTGRQVGAARWGGNATSISNVPGTVDAIELDECGKLQIPIPHALAGQLGPAQAGHLWPATRDDGDRTDLGEMMEGCRVVFPPTQQVNDWIMQKVRPEARPIAWAIRDYGIIFRDKTGGGVNLTLRNYVVGDQTNDATNWGRILSLYGEPNHGAVPNRYMTSFPWHLAVVVKPEQSL